MPSRVAVVSQKYEARPWLLDSLRSQYEVTHGEMTDCELRRLVSWRPDLIVCDAATAPPSDDAFRRLRALFRGPILVLAPERDESYTVRTLKLGADGCLNAPVGEAELLARVAAHLRRYWDWAAQANAVEPDTPTLVCVDEENCSVTLRNRTVRLTPTECRLLCRLQEQAGQAVPREELSRCLWGGEGSRGGAGLVSLYIHYLRQKLEDDPRYPRFIRTKRGGGYYLTGVDA